jgi:diguanylate cyclase (GGDEF)-like protein
VIFVYKLICFWRYYTLGREQYYIYLNNESKNNLYSLRLGNIIAAILAAAFAYYPVFIQKNIYNAWVHLLTVLIGVLLSVFTDSYIRSINNRKSQPSKNFTYVLIFIYYVNIIVFGLYASVWLNQNHYAVAFMLLLVFALLLFYISPILNLCLTLGAAAIFIIFSILQKSPEIYVYDICNVIIATFISLFVCWRVTMLRFVSDLSVFKIESERNQYLEESTVDELTQLRNRRDFMKTFKRFLVNYRSTDDYLCIAVADIDFFKNYNDFYGHPKGDECLRAIGEAVKLLKETMGVYCARVGGEEFALLWFEGDISHVNTVISRVSKLIHSLKIPHEKSGVCEYITMSLGVYIEKCGASTNTEELYDLADKALYCAKEKGRNCAIVRGTNIDEYHLAPEKD